MSATRGASGEVVAVALGYAAGSALVLLLLAYGGRHVLDRLRAAGRGPAVQRALGVVMVATAVAVATDLDVRFQTALANDFPASSINPTKALERSGAVEDRLADLRGRRRFAETTRRPRPRPHAGLPVLGARARLHRQPALVQHAGRRPLDLERLRGRVVLVDFWTYTCINCIRTLPYVRGLGRPLPQRAGSTVVGVHTPEFAFEQRRRQRRSARSPRTGLRYPVAQDNDYATWNAWGNQYWPAKYLIDARGRVRYAHFGEGDYDKTEAAIRSLLAEAGASRLGAAAHAPRGDARRRASRRPRPMSSSKRAQNFDPPLRPGVGSYEAPTSLAPVHFALDGTLGRLRRVGDRGARREHPRARDGAQGRSSCSAPATARPRAGQVLLDGKPIPDADAGEDVSGGRLTVGQQRLYRLVTLPKVEDRTVTIELAPGISAYAFTFG